jgi:hypothetical protein
MVDNYLFHPNTISKNPQRPQMGGHVSNKIVTINFKSGFLELGQVAHQPKTEGSLPHVSQGKSGNLLSEQHPATVEQ